MDWVGLEGLGIKALNRENRLECIRQSIRDFCDRLLGIKVIYDSLSELAP